MGPTPVLPTYVGLNPLNPLDSSFSLIVLPTYVGLNLVCPGYPPLGVRVLPTYVGLNLGTSTRASRG